MTARIIPLTAVTLGRAAGEFLARRDLDAGTIRSYTQTMNRLRRDLGDQAILTQLTPEQTVEAFEAAWSGAAARTWNRHRSALRSFTTWASAPARGYLHTDLAGLIDRRPEIQDRTRAIDRHQVDALWERKDIALREKTLWRMLYESAARADSVLSLNIQDLDLAKRGKVTAKGGTIIWTHWQSGTARLLPRLIAGRTKGPLFLADRRPGPHPRHRRSVPRHRTRTPVLRARRVPVQAGHRRADPAPTPPLPPDPPRRRRLVRTHAHGPVQPRQPAQPRHLHPPQPRSRRRRPRRTRPRPPTPLTPPASPRWMAVTPPSTAR